MICANALRLPYADSSASMALCSPPYFQKRRYAGVSPTLWPTITYVPMANLAPITIPEQNASLGLELDLLAYIGHLVLIGREIRRVVRDDGIWCCNIGDSFNSSRGAITRTLGNLSSGREHVSGPDRTSQSSRGIISGKAPGLKPKDLIMIPARLALALQADGWYLRSRMPGGVEMRPDVIWTKNAMPESVRDRPSVDFEDVFILTKSKQYAWDQENGRSSYRPHGGDHNGGMQAQAALRPRGNMHGDGRERFYGSAGANLRASWRINIST